MCSLNKSNKGYIKRKNLSRIEIGVKVTPKSLRDQHLCRKLCLQLDSHQTLVMLDINIHNTPLLNTKHNFFKNFFYHQQ